MAKDYKTIIKITDEEKNKIIDNSPKNLPLNPSAQGYSGAEIRKRLYQSTVGEDGSLLALLERLVDVLTTELNAIETDKADVSYADSGLSLKADKTYVDSKLGLKTDETYVDTELDKKVDKITGKGLSTNDYTTTEKNKLSGIEAGAEVNVQSDWTQEVNTADDYIKNKPAIPTKTSDLTNDTGYITGYTETDPIFTAWDKTTGISITKSQITDLIEATQAISGLMSATDKQRLDVLHALLEEDTANNVVDSINEILAIFNNYPEGADLVSALANKVDKNNAITAGTKAKITYDSKGLVTAGEDLLASDIPTLAPSKITQDANNRFVTDDDKSTWNGKQDALTNVTTSDIVTGTATAQKTVTAKAVHDAIMQIMFNSLGGES